MAANSSWLASRSSVATASSPVRTAPKRSGKTGVSVTTASRISWWACRSSGVPSGLVTSTSLTRAARSPERTSVISPGGLPTPRTPEFSFTSAGTIPYTYVPVCVDVGMSVLLPPTAAGALSLTLAAIREVPQLLGGGVEHALGLVPGPALLHVAEQSRQALLLLADVQAVDRLGKAQVGVDARDHDACVDGEHLDAHQRHPHVGVNYQALVENRLDDVGQSGGRRACAAAMHDRHVSPPRCVPARARGRRPLPWLSESDALVRDVRRVRLGALRVGALRLLPRSAPSSRS